MPSALGSTRQSGSWPGRVAVNGRLSPAVYALPSSTATLAKLKETYRFHPCPRIGAKSAHDAERLGGWL